MRCVLIRDPSLQRPPAAAVPQFGRRGASAVGIIIPEFSGNIIIETQHCSTLFRRGHWKSALHWIYFVKVDPGYDCHHLSESPHELFIC